MSDSVIEFLEGLEIQASDLTRNIQILRSALLEEETGQDDTE